MKQLIIPIIILSCTFFSCEKEVWHQTDNYPQDTTLAGSVSFYANRMNAEGIFNETALDTLENYGSSFTIKKVSDTVISFSCKYIFGGKDGEVTIISIPEIPITGRSFDVAFNHASSEVGVKHLNREYTSVLTSVKGWIKEPSIIKDRTKTKLSTKDIRLYYYDYQIDITCVLDGKILNIKTTKDKEKFPYEN